MPRYMTVPPTIPAELNTAYLEDGQFEEDFRRIRNRVLALERELEGYEDQELTSGGPQYANWNNRASWLRNEIDRWDQELSKLFEAMEVDVGDSHLDEGLVGETSENEGHGFSEASEFDTQVEKTVNDVACESDLSSDSESEPSETEANMGLFVVQDDEDEDEGYDHRNGTNKKVGITMPRLSSVTLGTPEEEGIEGGPREDSGRKPLLAVDVQNTPQAPLFISRVKPGEGGPSTARKSGCGKRTVFNGE